jgi:[acyl-carrier-protein] S-malonyltransferase
LANSQPNFLPDAPVSASAWLFPGQGAQEVGMGQDLWRQSPAARQVFETADGVLGYGLSTVCFEGPAEKLRDTEFAQPAIFATSLACLAAAIENGSITAPPLFMAGHSLGEYSALVAAGAMSLEEGLVLLRERARLMAQAGRELPGAMAAVLGMDEADVRDLCQQVDVDVCNLNLPTQTVIGGSPAGVSRAVELAKERGVRAMELNVSGAFHSRLMQPAVVGLTDAVARATISAPNVPVVANVNAQPMSTAEAVRDELRAQIAQPVRWHESVTLMASAGVTTYVEYGPGKVLTGLARRLVAGANLVNISGMTDVAAPA